MSRLPAHELDAKLPMQAVSADGGKAQGPDHPVQLTLSDPRQGPPSHPLVRNGHVHIHVDKQRRPSAFRWVLGLILVFAAGLVATSSSDSRLEAWMVIPWASDLFAKPSAHWVAGAVLLLLGGLCIKSNFPHFLLTASLIGVSTYSLNLLLAAGLDLTWMVTIALGLAYLIHFGRKLDPPSLGGIFGWVLMVGCAVGSARGWFDWMALGKRLGGESERFFHTWGPECTWGTVLILTAIGVTFSRRRPIHFLNAVLLGALAYYCIQQGFVKVIPFPELATTDVIPTIHQVSYKNVDPWRWVLAGEMVLLGAILLHQALGIGALTLAFALAWMVAGTNVDKAVGRITFTRYFSQALSQSTGGVSSGIDPAGSPDRPQPLIGWPSIESSRPTVANRSVPPPPQMTTAVVGATTLIVWLYLSALLAGLIGVSGLRLLFEDANHRMWVCYALWFVLGMGVMWLWSVWPMDPGQSWGKWMAAWGLSRYHTHAIRLVALGIMAISGSWALRRDSRIETWVHTAAASIFIGTMLSLIAVALLIKFGGFSPLPVWSYVVIAAGQSSMMWVLLMQQNLRVRHNVEGSTIY